MDEARLYGKPVIYEIDDNLVDPLPPYHPVHDYYCRAIRNLVERSIRKADLVTVSTEALGERFSTLQDRVAVIPNTVDLRFVNRSRNRTGKTRIGYSGTKTHDGDFEVVLPALKRLADEYRGRLSLVFLGYVPEALRGLDGIEEWQYTYAYSEYLKRLGRLGIDIAIAPLTDEHFNFYKSNIKYVEYSASGIAGIYTRCRAYSDSVQHEVTGLLVDHKEGDWYEATKALIEDPLTRKKLAASAERDVGERFVIDKACEAWEDALSHALECAPRRRPAKSRAVSRATKKVFFIGAGFLWPHTYIDDFLVNAFTALGLEVVYHPLSPTPFHKEALAQTHRFDKEYLKYTLSAAVQPDHLLRHIRREEPDFMFCIQGYMIPRDVLYELSRSGIPSAVWFLDEPYDATRSVPFGTFFNHVFLQDASTVDIHRRYGNPNAHYLPHGFDDQEVHVAKEDESFLWDLSVVGVGFPGRQEAVNRFIGKADLLLAGSNWDRFRKRKKVETRAVVPPHEAAEIYRRSRINLTIHRAEEDEATSPLACRAASPNGSLFYVAGCGGFQVADAGRKEVGHCFEPGKEIVLYEDMEDLEQKVAFYLKHDEARREICRAAHRRALAEHTYRHRLKRVLQVLLSGADAPSPRFYPTSILLPSGSDRLRLLEGEDVQTITFDHAEEPTVNILPGPDTDASTALNAAFFEASSPWTAVATASVRRLHEKVCLSMGDFNRTPDLGAVAFRTEDGRLTFSVVSNRILWRLGAFKRTYWGTETALEDLLLRLREKGFGVVSRTDTEMPETYANEIRGDRASLDAETFSRAWGVDPEARLKSKKLIGLGYALKGKEAKEVVRALYEKAVDMDPDYTDACREWGSLLLEDGKLEPAGAFLEKAWSDSEGDVPAGILYALYHIACKRDQEAIGLLQRLAEKEMSSRERTSVLFNLGRCHRKLGDKPQAVRCFETALEVDPNYDRILKELFSIHMESQDLLAALDCSEKITKIQPDNAEAFNDTGVLLFTLGRREESLEFLKRAVALDANFPDALENLRQVSESLGMKIASGLVQNGHSRANERG